jgi:hypothetical protein
MLPRTAAPLMNLRVMFPERVIILGLFNTAWVQSPVQSEMAKRLFEGEPKPLVRRIGGEV